MFDPQKCEACGVPMNLKRRGARSCSPRCRKRLSRRAPFPADMVGEDRWIRWAPVRRGGRVTKLPLTVDGRGASSTDPGTWSSYRVASSSTAGVGLGFVLGAGIGCIDLDDCIVGGVLESWADEVLAEHEADAVLVEVSQSGRGLHIFLPMLPGRGRVIRDGRNIEVYPPDSGRYIAVTGDTYRR